VLLGAALVAGSGTLSATAQAPSDSLTFTRTAFRDPAAGDVEAIVLLVPQGWQASGGVQWLPEWSRLAHLVTHVVDPASGITLAWLPIQDFIWFEAPAGLQAPIGGNYQGKAYVPPVEDPAEFVSRFWVPTVLPHLAEVAPVGRRRVPPIAEEFLRGFGGPGEADAWVLRYETEVDGRAWEQDVAFALLYSAANGITSWYVNFAYTVAGPRGSLEANEGIVSTIIASRTTTPEWEATYRLVQRLFYQGIRQQMADTVAFGELLARHRAESQALQEQVTAERWASQDRIAEYRRQILGGVENYRDPSTGTIVQLPVGWGGYWVNDHGEYLATDGTGDPNSGGGGGTWRRLEPREG
jgi:hypothetical protein